MQTKGGEKKLFIAKNIKEFFFDYAKYYVRDGDGDEIQLIVDYKNNTFIIESVGEGLNKKFRKEVEEKAKDLLKRKHGVNIVWSPKKTRS